MTAADFWCIERHGEPAEVMVRSSQSLPDPGPGQALVAIRAIGLNQSDLRYVQGRHFPPDSLPAYVGQEAVGEILALGPPTDDGRWSRNFEVGQRVATLPMAIDVPAMGVFRQAGLYWQSRLLPVPDCLSDREAAAYWVAFLTFAGALQMARRGPSNLEGKTVAVTSAAGGVGALGLKLAAAWGARTLATTRRPEKLAALRELAEAAVLVRRPVELTYALFEWTGGHGVDLLLDPLGGRFVKAGFDGLAEGGHIVSYEAVTGHKASLDVFQLMVKDARLHGFTVHRLLRHRKLLYRLVDLGLGEAERARPALAADFPFDRAPQALQALARSDHVGKITVTL